MFEIFRAGKRTDNTGVAHNIPPEVVAEVAAGYQPELHEAPIVIGHPKTDDPAWGWVKSLRAEDGVLSAEFADMDDDFAAAVKKRRYAKVSASFYPPQHPANPKPGSWYLRHVGFLGATPPAVKGLAAISFSEDDGCLSFAEAEPETVGLLRGLMRKLGFSAADFSEEAPLDPPINPQPDPTPKPDEPKQETLMPTEEQLAAEKAAREAAEAKAAAAEAELKKLQDEQEQDLRGAAHQANADFAEGLVKAGRLKPADKDLVIQALDFAEHPEHTTADFGEGDKKKPLGTALRDFLAAVLPVQLAGGEQATAGKAAGAAAGVAEFAEYADADALSHHERALAMAAKEGIAYDVAARRTAGV